MIDALRQHQQVALENFDANPFSVIRFTDVKVAASPRNIADLVIVMDVLLIVQRVGIFVRGALCRGRVGDFVAELEALGLRKLVKENGRRRAFWS